VKARLTVTVGACGLALTGLAGCAGKKAQREAAPSAGLNSLGAENSPAPGGKNRSGPVAPGPEAIDSRQAQDMARDAALNLQQILSDMDQKAAAGAPAWADNTPAAGASGAPELMGPPAPPPGAVTAADLVIPSETPPKPLDQRITEASMGLVDMLRQRAAETKDAGVARSAYLAMAALEVLKPGATQTVVSATGIGVPLAGDDRVAVEAVRQFAAGLGAPAAEKETLADRVESLAVELAGFRSLRVNAELCSKVTGYGQYVGLGTTKFLQGRPTKAVVYAEVSNFAHRGLSGTETAAAYMPDNPTHDRWAVDLTEELRLYHSDDVVVWARPEQGVVETSRNKRRDFYLVQTVTFPPTLSVGAYTLKVIVRDKVKNQVCEAAIPFEVVAEEALTRPGAGVGTGVLGSAKE
jgi:hypothetical protein